MLIELIYTIGGFILLVGGADRFVSGAAATARILGMAPVLVGLTVVAFATSAPEILVSVTAATSGFTGMAVGNAVGSNIANVGLVLGATALIRPLQGGGGNLRQEVPVLLLLTVLAGWLFTDNQLDRLDSLLLITALAGFLLWVVSSAAKLPADDPVIRAAVQDTPDNIGAGKAALLLTGGLVVLLVGAELLVSGASGLAQRFGLSDLAIGLSVVAIGTSLPELAISVISALRGKADIAVGNIVGSNVFNLLAVIGFAGLIAPGPLDSALAWIHVPIMFLFSLMLLRLAYNSAGKPAIGRGIGAMLLAGFIAYQYFLLAGRH